MCYLNLIQIERKITMSDSISKFVEKQDVMYQGKLLAMRQGNCLGYFYAQMPETPFSNFYDIRKGFNLYFADSKISYKKPKDGVKYKVGNFRSVEQLFAFGKAITMHDDKSAKKIYKLRTPSSVKYLRLGRAVKNYDDEKWEKIAATWMLQGMLAKFSQDKFCHKCLMATGFMVLMECNPYSTYWGAGIGIKQDFKTAPGKNMQGWLLMQTRSILQKELK